MLAIKRILCPIDFFPASIAAVSYAARLAAQYGASVDVLHVISPGFQTPPEYAVDIAELIKTLRQTSDREMKKIEVRIRRAGAVAKSRLRLGNVCDAIEQEIDNIRPDLMVLGTHGRRGVKRWLLGSTTEKLLRRTKVPLLTVSGPGERRLIRMQRILVTTDFSEGTSDALAYALSLAEKNKSQITLLHVVEDVAVDLSGIYRGALLKGVQSQLEDLVPAAARKVNDIVTKVDIGRANRVIPWTLESKKIDLVVMNTHGKGMIDRALVGSTAERVVRAAVCPVLLIPPIRKGAARSKIMT